MAVDLDNKSAAPSEKRDFTIRGRVAGSLTNEALKGVNVKMTTSCGSYSTKTDGAGYYTLNIEIEVVANVETILVPFEFEKDKITTESHKIVRVNGKDIIEYTINYNKGQATGIGTAKNPAGNNASRTSIRFAKNSAIDDIYYQLNYTEIPKTVEKGYKVNETPNINYTFPKYNPQSIAPYTQKQNVRYYINVVKLVTTKKQTEKDVSQTGTLDSKTTKEINKGGSRATPTPQKTILKAANTLSDKLLPYIIGILAVFGISQVKNWLNGSKNLQNTETTCPSIAKLNRQIRKRNNIVKQLNNLYKIINAATKAIGIALGLIKIFQLILNIFKRLPIPSTIGTPPGPAGGVITSASYGQLISNSDKFNKLKEKLKIFAKIGGIVLTSLILLRSLLSTALDLLGLADQKMQECAEQIDPLPFIPLSDELIAISKQQVEEELSPVITSVNGFTMGVVTDPKHKVGTLNRRRATATNPQGVVMLRGEPSFSASDQILIDELAFYITNNNLKA
tara:strand:- start:7899 stop:9422 length:1524 start_codon:yes stop_codon:yes gene_type:complete